jgi:hypothetical protein
MGLKCLRDLANIFGAFLIVRLSARSDTVLSTLQLSHPVQSAQTNKFYS